MSIDTACVCKGERGGGMGREKVFRCTRVYICTHKVLHLLTLTYVYTFCLQQVLLQTRCDMLQQEKEHLECTVLMLRKTLASLNRE